ncbi:unnamed protein product [Pleuronectes platessa]|uniref:Ion transport domain-containing protein n=1 Tax=Pleuronectes platessa TaxID=8262 RepID=A0A9N7YAS9_PLEPL|nr:unnamed protein product [Pleuronectes platessa]
MFHPCEDSDCKTERCRILQDFDDFIFAFFAVEMVIKMVALGIFGKNCYLGDTWNRLDFFIVLAGMLEYSLNLQSVSFSAVRTVRVLRPLRAINRVPTALFCRGGLIFSRSWPLTVIDALSQAILPVEVTDTFCRLHPPTADETQNPDCVTITSLPILCHPIGYYPHILFWPGWDLVPNLSLAKKLT